VHNVITIFPSLKIAVDALTSPRAD